MSGNKKTLEMLNRTEVVVLQKLLLLTGQPDRYVDENDLMNALKDERLEETALKRALIYLENKGLVKIRRTKKVRYVITARGKSILEQGTPEERLFSWLKTNPDVRVADLSDSGLNREEINVALGRLKKQGVLDIQGGRIALKTDSYVSPVSQALKSVEKGEQPAGMSDLESRGLVERKEREVWEVTLTDRAIESREDILHLDTDFVDRLTRELLVSGAWKGKRFRRYDVESPVPEIWGGRKHPLRLIWESVRDVFLEMGFVEMTGNWVDLVFWNMDAMFIPQDHPARDVQDTFYLGVKADIGDIDLVNRVKSVHETGGDTGSLGWQFPWDPEVPKELMLRSHTTCLTFRTLASGITPPCKYFAIGRVFRNEAIDRFHLPEFHQIEGFVASEGLTLRDLFGYIKEFYDKIGIKKLRFKPTYNPYTEPSAEIFAYHKGLNRWIEVGNSGMFRPESLRPYNVNVPVIAWGLALERLAMLTYQLDDIRELVGHTCDINWLRTYQLPEMKL
ncbi:phenylalanine--tRNA ligase subunit alpha [Candidatus Micrarchaeota archaeon]|nr:phenylalanine--tRNA ligase subunit alpha [Candidatus Micrarchaeota archaeon]